MPQSLKNTWIAIIIAALATSLSGTFIIKRFIDHVMIECRGTLRSVPASELSDSEKSDLKKADARSDLDVRYDEIKPPDGKSWSRDEMRTKYKNVRVVWNRSDVACACADVPVKWDPSASSYSSPYNLRIYRDEVTGLYVVRDTNGSANLAVFRKVDDKGHRFQSDRVFEPHNISMLVFLVALLALGVAGYRALRATPYASRMHTWTPATLRPDGLVESDTGVTLGTMDLRSRVPAGKIIVDPTALEGRDVYREMPILTRKTVGAGSHERWVEGTMRRLRDARSLAIVSTMTTIFALIARVVGG